MQELTVNDAVSSALAEEMRRDPRVLMFGEDAVEDLSIGGKTYLLTLRHTRYPLPVLVTLKDFRREVHRGTEMARSFSTRPGTGSAPATIWKRSGLRAASVV